MLYTVDAPIKKGSHRTLIKLTWTLLATICLATLYYHVVQFAVDIPFIDDYNGLYDFVIKYFESDTFNQKIYYIFRQHNEHRIAFARLMVLLDYYLFGVVNLRHLIILGSLNLIVMAAIFTHEIRKVSTNILALTPIVFVFFHFQHGNNLLWAESSLQNLSVLSLACTSIWLATRKNTALEISGLFVAALATFASGTGPLIWIAIGMVALINPNKIKILSIVFVGGISMFFYFHGYHASDRGNLFSFEKIINIVVVVFGVIGSAFDIRETDNHALPVIAGFGMTALFVFVVFKNGFKNLQESPRLQFLLGVFLFCLLSALAIGIGRNSFIENRYKVISSLAVLVTFSSLIPYIQRRNRLAFFSIINVVAFGGWLLFFWRYYPEMITFTERKIAHYATLINTPKHPVSAFQYRLDRLSHFGVWSPPSISEQHETGKSKVEKFSESASPIGLKEKDKYSLSWHDESKRNETGFLVLESGKSKVFYFIEQERNPLNSFLRTGEMYSGKRKISILRSWVPKGNYQASIYYPGEAIVIPISDTLQINKTIPPWLTFNLFNDQYEP